MNDYSIATGFEFKPQADGTVIIEFHDDHGKPINAQILSRNAFLLLPLGAFVATTAMDLTAELSKKLARVMQAAEEDAENGK